MFAADDCSQLLSWVDTLAPNASNRLAVSLILASSIGRLKTDARKWQALAVLLKVLAPILNTPTLPFDEDSQANSGITNDLFQNIQQYLQSAQSDTAESRLEFSIFRSLLVISAQGLPKFPWANSIFGFCFVSNKYGKVLKKFSS